MPTMIKAPPVVKQTEGSSGGGVLGTILGGIAAAATAIAVPGLGLAAAPAAFGVGSTLGGAIGGIAKPAEAATSSAQQAGTSDSSGGAIARKFGQEAAQNAASGDSQKILAQSLQAAASPDVPEAARNYAAPILARAFKMSLGEKEIV